MSLLEKMQSLPNEVIAIYKKVPIYLITKLDNETCAWRELLDSIKQTNMNKSILDSTLKILFTNLIMESDLNRAKTNMLFDKDNEVLFIRTKFGTITLYWESKPGNKLNIPPRLTYKMDETFLQFESLFKEILREENYPEPFYETIDILVSHMGKDLT